MSERENLEQAIVALQAQRAILGDAVVDAALAPIREKLAVLEFPPPVGANAPTGGIRGGAEQQRKQATILFADISGFTALSETLDAEKVSDTMGALWKRIDAAIEMHGGVIDKHIGDAVMALWGVDQAREDDPERAIRAALDMQAELAAFREEHNVPLAMRVGLNTGLVLLGEVRPGEFTALGDTVNLASQMEQAAPVGNVLIPHDTYRHVRGIFDVQPQEPLEVKGRAEPVQIYVVQRARRRAFRVTTRGIEGVETHMVGRDVELLTLQNIFRDVIEDATTHVVTIAGDAGVGKSRLLHEFERWIKSLPACGELAESNPINRLKGRATLETQNTPYSIVRDMFAFRFAIRESDSAAVALEKFRAGTAAVLDPEKADLIGHLIGFDFSASRAVNNLLGSKSFAQLAIADLTNYLRAITAAPTVIFLEDVHWADDSSLDLIKHVVTALPDVRLLIVCLARRRFFERRPHWGKDWEAHTQLDLKPLSRRASRALVDEILQKVEHIPPALRDLVVKGAEGNPFYVEELIKMLIEDGVIVRGEEWWRVELERLAEVRVPPTLTGILQARLDGLPRGERAVLQQASVVGRLFWDEAVAELTDDEVNAVQVDALLDAVGNRELVFRQDRSAFEGTEEYIFKHAILRDVTYETVLLKLRRVYHKQVAQWLESVAGERIGEYLSLVAHHYELAGEKARAADYLRRSGEESLRVSDFRDAARAFERALALTSENETASRGALMVAVGHSYERLSDYSVATQYLKDGLALAQTAEDRATMVSAYNGLSYAAYHQSNFDRAQHYAERARALARDIGDQVGVADGLNVLGLAAKGLGQYDEARKYFEMALGIAQEIGDRRQESVCLNSLGIMATYQGDYIKRQEYFEQALMIDQEIGDQAGEGQTLGNLGVMAHIQGNYARAREYYKAALAICREIGNRRRESISLNNLGIMASYQGDYAGAQEYYEAALEMYREIGDRQGEGFVLHDLGALARAVGDLIRAETFFRQALTIREELDQPQFIVEDQAGLAGVALERGELAAAQTTLAPVLSYLAENPTLDGPEHPYRISLVCGQVLLVAEEIAQAREIVEAAYARLIAQAERLSTPDEREQFWQTPEYTALRRLWAELTLEDTPDE